MPDVVIAQPAVASAPADFTIAGAQAFELLSVQAAYDGSGAGGAFLPALQLIDPGGHVMSTAIASSVAAGASAAVSWFPGVGAPDVDAGAGIQYGVNNSGTWLDVETTSTGGNYSKGIALVVTGASHELLLEATGNGGAARLQATAGAVIVSATGDVCLIDSDTELDLLYTGIGATGSGAELKLGSQSSVNARVHIGVSATDAITIGAGTSSPLGFYGHAGTTRQAHPVTLADVITILTNLGLCA